MDLSIERALQPEMLSIREWDEIRCTLRLSIRELEIATLILSNQPNKVIAHTLGISVHTVNTHLDRLYRKLGVSSREQLILRILYFHLSLIKEQRGTARAHKTI